MEIALWIVSGLLAAAFVAAGVVKVVRSKENLRSMLPWTEDLPPWLIKFIGVAEFLGGVGIVVPWLTGIVAVLTPLAATGLAIIQALAIVVHIRRGEARVAPANALLLLTAAFVAVFRFLAL